VPFHVSVIPTKPVLDLIGEWKFILSSFILLDPAGTMHRAPTLLFYLFFALQIIVYDTTIKFHNLLYSTLTTPLKFTLTTQYRVKKEKYTIKI